MAQAQRSLAVSTVETAPRGNGVGERAGLPLSPKSRLTQQAHRFIENRRSKVRKPGSAFSAVPGQQGGGQGPLQRSKRVFEQWRDDAEGEEEGGGRRRGGGGGEGGGDATCDYFGSCERGGGRGRSSRVKKRSGIEGRYQGLRRELHEMRCECVIYLCVPSLPRLLIFCCCWGTERDRERQRETESDRESEREREGLARVQVLKHKQRKQKRKRKEKSQVLPKQRDLLPTK
jgi:hypothetical protein